MIYTRERKEMEKEIARLRDEIKSAKKGRGTGGATPEVDRLIEENDRLQAENAKLTKELQAFDLDFFEEIEDLKYKYSQAKQKLQMYEGGTGR